MDPAREEYAVRPLESKISYQLVGFKPDLNRNGVDDAIDIARRPRADRNRDGVPDSVQR